MGYKVVVILGINKAILVWPRKLMVLSIVKESLVKS